MPFSAMVDGTDSSFLIVDSRIRIPLREFTFTFARSSGAGGQNVNKVNSKAIMRWNIVSSPSLPEGVRRRFLESYGNRLAEGGDVILMSDEHRDQVRNRETCLQRLAAMIRSVARPPKARIKTKPTFSSKKKRLRNKREHGEKKAGRRKPGPWDD